eukprot:Nk52_evm1s487 gene=Nk52_evmTU1s487
MFDSAEEAIREALRKIEYMVCLTTDVWTSKQKHPFAAFTCHYVDEQACELKSVVLSFQNMLYPHTGQSLFEREKAICDSFAITNKLFGKTTDCASNNISANSMNVPRDGEECPFKTVNTWYCRPHRLNTCAQRFWDPKKKLLIDADKLVKLKQAEIDELKKMATIAKEPEADEYFDMEDDLYDVPEPESLEELEEKEELENDYLLLTHDVEDVEALGDVDIGTSVGDLHPIRSESHKEHFEMLKKELDKHGKNRAVL